MRKILFMFGELNDQDIEWIVSMGDLIQVHDGEALIEQGVQSDSMYIVIEGQLAIDVAGLGRVSTVGAGEVLGEISFVDSRPPTATVSGAGSAKVLAINKDDMTDKLTHDQGFAARFYRALAVFLADRLRSQYQSAESDKLSDDVEIQGELDMDVLDKVTIASARFELLLRRLGQH